MAANLAPSLASRATNPASVSHEGFVWEAEPQVLQTIIRARRRIFAPCWLSVKKCSFAFGGNQHLKKTTSRLTYGEASRVTAS
tara:strand:+ start:562 stop:810 length:249 start_codon:yes stop_codon:yes gene_type:complete